QALLMVAALGAPGDVQLVHFTAPWCHACKQTDPFVQQLAQAGYTVHDINVDDRPDVAHRFHVQTLPCFVIVANGREVDRFVGGTTLEQLQQMLDKAGAQPNSRRSDFAEPAAASRRAPATLATRAPEMASIGRSTTAGANDDFASSQASNAPRSGRYRASISADNSLAGNAPLPRSTSEGRALPSSRAVSRSNLQSGADAFQRDDDARRMTVRGQDANATRDSLPAEELAMQATVRLKIEDESGFSYGTGTIVDVHGQEGLILTCGHVFRDSRGRGRITVHSFAPGSRNALDGKLVRYDLEHDLALVSVRLDTTVQPIRVAPTSYQSFRNEDVFSVGCNHGSEPTIMNGRILDVNRYVGPPANLVVSGKPVDGRSGGGLFNRNGMLVGVCQAADLEMDEGLYGHLPSIYAHLDDANLSFVYQRQDDDIRANQATDSPINRPLPNDRRRERSEPDRFAADTEAIQRDSSSQLPSSADVSEVVCIVRSKSDPTGNSQVIVLNQPTREFLQRLSAEQQTQHNRMTTQTRISNPQR
ncbi:MAG: trypsin-like peptidase domain-containing protein, partial [Pirellulaceae bacterium]